MCGVTMTADHAVVDPRSTLCASVAPG